MNKEIKAVSWWRTNFGEEEIQRVRDSIANEHLTMGPVTAELEERIAKSLNVPYCLATNNGSIALLMSCMALEIGLGDEVLVPSRTWIATAHAPYILGAKVVLVDCEEDAELINIPDLKSKITPNTKAIIPVHLNGRDSHIEEINQIAKEHGLFVIEDACQALFSRNSKGYLGTQSDIGCFSLGINKLISSGGYGGLIVTRNKDFYEKLKLIRNNGTISNIDPLYSIVGCNFKFSDLQAAISLAQLDKFKEKKDHVMEIYRRYTEALGNLSSLRIMPVEYLKGEIPLYTQALCKDRSKLANFLSSSNIQVRPLNPSLDSAPYLKSGEIFTNSDVFNKQGIFLPCGPSQPLENVDYVIQTIKSFEKS